MASKVLIVIGSDSDLITIKPAIKQLKNFQVEYEVKICSAHRSPLFASQLAQSAEAEGFGVIIAAAGLAAHLPGVLAAYTILPIIGIPCASGALKGMDALYSIVQMPSGIPVACVGIDNATNAAILATQILSLQDVSLKSKLKNFKLELAQAVAAKNEKLPALLADLEDPK